MLICWLIGGLGGVERMLRELWLDDIMAVAASFEFYSNTLESRLSEKV